MPIISIIIINTQQCIIKSFQCENIEQAVSYDIMEFYVLACYYVTTIMASLICMCCHILGESSKTKEKNKSKTGNVTVVKFLHI